MAVERYLVNLSVVVEVEEPGALIAMARYRFVEGAPPSIVDMFVPDAAGALEQLVDPESVTRGLPGVAYVRSTTGAVLLDPEKQ